MNTPKRPTLSMNRAKPAHDYSANPFADIFNLGDRVIIQMRGLQTYTGVVSKVSKSNVILDDVTEQRWNNSVGAYVDAATHEAMWLDRGCFQSIAKVGGEA